MPNWDLTFKSEYTNVRTNIGTEANYAESWRPLIKKLIKLMELEGFDPSKSGALDELRKYVKYGDSTVLGYKSVTEDEGLLRAVSAASAVTLSNEVKKQLAALKLLRHVYLISRWGNRKVWIVSLPTELLNWPSLDFAARGTTVANLKPLLKANSEIFDAVHKKNLGKATFHALAWCQKLLIVLAAAASSASGKSKSTKELEIVKRWFASSSTSDVTLTSHISKLITGFKAILACLNKGHFVLTDYASLRTATNQDDIDWTLSEAFTFANFGEGMDVVYIEKSFFANQNVFTDDRNCIRIIVHELSHLVCGTADVNYAWQPGGIKPGGSGVNERAIENADSWAYFSADCAGKMTAGDITRAMNGL